MSAQQLQQLYRAHLRASERFAAYNFRKYFTRWTHTTFKTFEQQQQAITDTTEKEASLQRFTGRMQRELQARERQALVNSMYQVDRLVVEQQQPEKEA